MSESELRTKVGIVGVRDVTERNDAEAGVEQAIAALAACYRSWLAEATPIADAPTIAVLHLVLATDPTDARA